MTAEDSKRIALDWIADHAGFIVDAHQRIWELAESREWLSFEHPSGVSTPVIFSPQGEQLAGIEKNVLKLWDAQIGAELQSLTGYGNTINTLAYLPDGKHLVTAGDTAKVILWDSVSGSELSSWKAHTGRLNALAI